jgi:archaellum component FlaF (FlaF/FlaG flagellin family)
MLKNFKPFFVSLIFSFLLCGNVAFAQHPNIEISHRILNFDEVLINSSKSLTITLTNTGTVDLEISEVSISGDGFTLFRVRNPIAIYAGNSTNIVVQFSPIEVKAYTGTITLTHNAGNSPITIPLTGTGIEPRPNIEISHRILNFDEVLINSSKSLTITLTNTGTVDLGMSEVSISVDGFTLFRVGSPITISAGNSTNIAVQFSPIEVRAYTGTITLTHNAGNSPITIPLTGTGAEPTTHSITVSPNPLAFGDVKLSSYRDLPIVIKNESNVGLIITNFEINVGNVSSFSIEDAIDIAVAPAVSYTATVRFSPDGTGAKVATLKIVTNIGEETVNLSGSGTPTISVDKLKEIPTTYNLMQNYPNPFNPTTIIEYTIPKDEFVKLTVYDINGKIIKELVNDYKSVGKYSVGFNASGYSSGTYYYKLEAGEYKNMKKMVLLK